MAKNEIHHGLKDSNNDGAAPDLVNEGDAITTADGQLVFLGWDQAGDAKALEWTTEGAAILTTNISVMPCKDDGGLIQYIPMEGNAIRVTSEGAKTAYSGKASFTPSASAAEETMFTFDMGAAGETLDDLEWHFSCDRDLTANFYYVDDQGGAETETLIWQIRVNGDEDNQNDIDCLSLDTTGGTATQSIRVKVTQKQGTPSAMFGYVCVKADN